MWFEVLPLSRIWILDERRSVSWRLASALVLISATLTVGRAPHNALFLMGMAITAGLVSIFVESKFLTVDGKIRIPSGALALWWFIALVISLHANFPGMSGRAALLSVQVSQQTLWQLLALIGLGFSLGFNGSRALLVALAGVWVCAGVASFHGVSRATLMESAPLTLILSYGIAATVLLLRHSRAMTNHLESSLNGLSQNLSETRLRLGKQTEELALARESLLGGFDLQSEQAGTGLVEWVRNRHQALVGLAEQSRPVLNFEDLIFDLRTVFQEFQSEGRKRGEILGPVRFVFFPPASGYDSKAEVSVDRDQLKQGLLACLQLAYESLPESAGRRREGVVRLSIRRGLRVVEIAVEDNGRGLSNHNLKVETDLRKLRESVELVGGRFDRIARLGVGSRTSMELKILRQLPKSANYRPTIRHSGTAADVEMQSGIEPLSHSEI